MCADASRGSVSKRQRPSPGQRWLGARALAGVLLLVAGALGHSGAAGAGIYIVPGLSFSDELGGFELLSVSGTGTVEDPIVIRERFARAGVGILTIRLHNLHGHDELYRQTLRIAVRKVVINASRRVWAGFNIELQEELGLPSGYADGLSFDQLRSYRDLKPLSDRFTRQIWRAEPQDRIAFRDGGVNDGDIVTLQFPITDVTPKKIFYLRQEPELLSANLFGLGRLRFAWRQ